MVNPFTFRSIPFVGPQYLVMFLLLFDLIQFVKNNIIEHLDVCSAHTGRSGFNDPGTLKLAKRIYDHRPGNADTVCDLAGHKNSFLASELVKNMYDRFQL